MSEPMKEFFEDTMQMSPDVFSMSILKGVLDECAGVVEKTGGILLEEYLVRSGALMSSLIETIQISRKKGNFDDLVGFLGAMRFRYCRKEGENKDVKSLN